MKTLNTKSLFNTAIEIEKTVTLNDMLSDFEGVIVVKLKDRSFVSYEKYWNGGGLRKFPNEALLKFTYGSNFEQMRNLSISILDFIFEMFEVHNNSNILDVKSLT